MDIVTALVRVYHAPFSSKSLSNWVLLLLERIPTSTLGEWFLNLYTKEYACGFCRLLMVLPQSWIINYDKVRLKSFYECASQELNIEMQTSLGKYLGLIS